MLEPGFEIGHYRIVKHFGAGGMADVYEAEDINLGRHVALKLLPVQFTRDPQLVERFSKEVRAAAQLEHPNIVPIYEVGVDDHYQYYTMKLLRGGDLKDRIASGLTVQQSFSILAQLAEAFKHAHSRGFVHRDVKPENVMFDQHGRPVLTDFGIAKAMGAATRMTATGMAVGTPRYISPEQARGREVDGRSDLYALGVVLFEMLTGNVPYDAEESMAVIFKHVSEPIPQLPAELAEYQPLIERMMAKEPDERHPDAQALIDDLAQYLPPQPYMDTGERQAVGGAPTPGSSSAYASGARPRANTPVSQTAKTRISGAMPAAAPPPAPAKRGLGWLWLLLLLLGVGGAVAGWWFAGMPGMPKQGIQPPPVSKPATPAPLNTAAPQSSDAGQSESARQQAAEAAAKEKARQRKAPAAAEAKAQREAAAKAAEQARRQREADEKKQAEQAARRKRLQQKQEENERARRAAEQRAAAAAEAAAKAREDARRREAAERRAEQQRQEAAEAARREREQADAEAAARRERELKEALRREAAEAEAKREAERKAQIDARRKAAAAARAKEEARQKQLAEEAQRREAEAQRRREAERNAEQRARAAEAKRQAEERAAREAEERRRRQAAEEAERRRKEQDAQQSFPSF